MQRGQHLLRGIRHTNCLIGTFYWPRRWRKGIQTMFAEDICPQRTAKRGLTSCRGLCMDGLGPIACHANRDRGYRSPFVLPERVQYEVGES